MSLKAMHRWQLLVIFSCFCVNGLAEMETFIVGGERVPIDQYPFIAFLDISCYSVWTCGSSIINQNFMLTAAHCVAECTANGYISVSVGSAHKYKGIKSSVYKVKAHEKYIPSSLAADIALVQIRTPLVFGLKVQRVILAKNPPFAKAGYVAGWGWIDEHTGKSGKYLKHLKQKIWNRQECSTVLYRIAENTFCAGAESGSEYPSSGDSGSPFFIRGNIQIGIVSYKQPYISSSVVVYVNISYYRKWISRSSKIMFCN